jgi:hypothetical protein
MTKHLEERLSEALDAAAHTVPDNAVPPELFPVEERPSERRWVPVVVGGLAVAAVVAAVAVPLAISRNNSVPLPADSPCASPPSVAPMSFEKRDYTDPDYADLNKLPFGPPPKVPFTMTHEDLRAGYLEDRGVRVPLEGTQQVYSIGRVMCGWVAFRHSGKQGDEAEVGVLSTDGKYRSFGKTTGDGAALSPDGSEVAYVASTGAGKASVVTVSVASGKRLAETPAGVDAEVDGWNSHGVWLMVNRDQYVTQVWKPGGKPVTVDTDRHQLTAYRGTDRMLLSDQEASASGTGAPEECVRVVTLEATNKLHTVLQECGGSTATLSPDGKVLVADVGSVQGYLVDTGAKTSFRVSSMLLTPDHESVWEDSTHLLESAGLGTDRQVTLRCDVLTGSCERLQDGPQQGAPVGPDLSYP